MKRYAECQPSRGRRRGTEAEVTPFRGEALFKGVVLPRGSSRNGYGCRNGGEGSCGGVGGILLVSPTVLWVGSAGGEEGHTHTHTHTQRGTRTGTYTQTLHLVPFGDLRFKKCRNG